MDGAQMALEYAGGTMVLGGHRSGYSPRFGELLPSSQLWPIPVLLEVVIASHMLSSEPRPTTNAHRPHFEQQFPEVARPGGYIHSEWSSRYLFVAVIFFISGLSLPLQNLVSRHARIVRRAS